MYLLRGLAVWVLMIFVESVHGTLRQLFLAPLVGDFPARRIAFFTGLLLIFALSYFFIRWIAAPSKKSLFAVGLLWIILPAGFEFGLGRLVLNYSWERMLQDYDLSRGGLMGLGLGFLLFVPYLSARIRDLRKTNPV